MITNLCLNAPISESKSDYSGLFGIPLKLEPLTGIKASGV